VLTDKVAFAVAVLAGQRDRALALDVADDLRNSELQRNRNKLLLAT
jgi:hypothetical protein